jgi:hypothetical protein|nr:MAG TPA: hypothetical protein [Caudoviricetes sp.]
MTDGVSLADIAAVTDNNKDGMFGGAGGGGMWIFALLILLLIGGGGFFGGARNVNGAPVQGATALATATAAGDIVTLPISALVRLNCDCDTANLTIVIGGQVVTAQNLALVV